MASKNNKVALVVGASRGIGRQVAIDLAKNGYAGINAFKSSQMSANSVLKLSLQPNPHRTRMPRSHSHLIRTPRNPRSARSRERSRKLEGRRRPLL
jgi:NAD(P)-dependent dehydrogenase (short-subunit alcohol dehydrogenase family)